MNGSICDIFFKNSIIYSFKTYLKKAYTSSKCPYKLQQRVFHRYRSNGRRIRLLFVGLRRLNTNKKINKTNNISHCHYK